MAFLAVILAIGILAILFRRRLDALEDTIYGLVERVDALERSHGRTHESAAPAPVAGPPRVPRDAPALRPSPPTAATTPVPPPPPRDALPSAHAPAPSTAVLPSIAQAAATPDAAAAAPEVEAGTTDTLETRIGGRWLLYIGVAAIVIGMAYFEKLAIDNHWVDEKWRVIQGGAIGAMLVGGGLQFVRKGYGFYGQILSGAGIAVLYVSIYAAFNFYHLLPQPVAFGLMIAVTALGAWLADRLRSQGLALVAIAGGFSTPFLLPSATDAEAALFGYDMVLVGATVFLSQRRDWPALNVVSYGFTALTILAWSSQFYAPAKYLATETFLTVFCGMFLYALRAAANSSHRSANAVRAILWTAPFAYYIASLAVLAEHSSALLIYLVLLSLAGVLVGVRAGSGARLVFWMLAAAPLLLWSDAQSSGTWPIAGLAAWAAVYALTLAGLLEATARRHRTAAPADIALLHLNPLVSYAGAYLLIEPVRVSACAPVAAALAVANGAIALAIAKRSRSEALHVAAAAFTLLVIAAGLQFEGPWMTAAWAAEGAVVVWLGLREAREWMRGAGLLLFAAAIFRLLALQLSPPPPGQVLLLNARAACGAFVILLTCAIAIAHRWYGGRTGREREVGFGFVVAQLLLLASAASEVAAYWALHPAPPFEPAAQIIAISLIVGAAIMWLSLRRREEGLRAIGAAVAGIAAASLFAIQLQPAPPGYVPIVNGRAGAGALAVAILGALAPMHRRRGGHLADLSTNVAILTTSAGLLALSLLTSEIDAFWALRGAPESRSLSREALHVIAWGGVGGFLVWNGLVNARGWVRGIGGALLAIGILRLLGLQSAAPGPAYAIVANARVMASLVVIALLYGLAHRYRAADVAEPAYPVSAVLWLAANALTLTLATSEITAYWHAHDLHTTSPYTGLTSRFAREAMLSITWAVYALTLVIVGLWKRYAPIRYFAMVVFVVTIVKVFAIDLAELDRIYRVLSVIGLGVTLLLTSYLYQRLSSVNRRH